MTTKIVTAIVASIILISPAFAHERGDDHGHHYHGAPGPIAGASLPVLAVGYGVYWLVRRARRKAEAAAAARKTGGETQ